MKLPPMQVTPKELERLQTIEMKLDLLLRMLGPPNAELVKWTPWPEGKPRYEWAEKVTEQQKLAERVARLERSPGRTD